jgi:nucleoside-diphosphate-sugar epimerase
MNKIIEEDLEEIVKEKLPWNKLEGKNILITGANGFVPAYIVRTIQHLNKIFKKKATLFLLVRNKNESIQKFGEDENINYIVQDVCEPIILTCEVNYVIHAASPASPKYFAKDPVGTALSNTIGTNNLLKILINQKNLECFLFISSGEIYGDAEFSLLDEKVMGKLDPTDVRSCYSESKRMGENLCVCYNKQYGIPVKMARLFHVYGPGMNLQDGRLVVDFVSNIVNKRDIQVKSKGLDFRTFLYLSDATIGLFTILLKGEIAQAYNVSNGFTEISVNRLAKKLAGIYNLGIVYTESTDTLQRKVKRSFASTKKIEGLGWNPKHLLESGFTRTVESYNIT